MYVLRRSAEHRASQYWVMYLWLVDTASAGMLSRGAVRRSGHRRGMAVGPFRRRRIVLFRRSMVRVRSMALREGGCYNGP